MRIPRRLARTGVAGIVLAAALGGSARASTLGLSDYGCEVTYTSIAWSTGFSMNLTIANTGTLTFSPWILQFVFSGSQHVDTAWSGTWSQTPPSVQVTNPAWHNAIAPGTTYAVGFNATGTAETPARFTLNGVPCKVTS
ncbi:cellulose binding domain-containing protein [Microbispora sp. RL4-1S]|uniref:Cellulose binding domain-containing protein n=1 Tax=Microbispora oryzae TaxID=2806554 RepID=A0A941ASJ9_9ACTN|nr:cellulose binding domain-containing protein [Microbispora oryzae]MBP2708539.1 cellulose binding domain-containing protein [Microbispora oryzae]